MIDAHCHIDAYPDPFQMAMQTERSKVLTIAVTNLPSAFELAYPHVRKFRYLRLAVGLHPLMAKEHKGERSQFAASFQRTSYVGEIGLDFSPEGQPTREEQIESFLYVLHLLQQTPKFVTVHSRRAEKVILDLLEEAKITPVVFHWFSGSLTQLDRLLKLGHYCSVNPAMLQSKNGRMIIEQLPKDRIITETDGPFTRVASRPAVPADVKLVEEYLSKTWNYSLSEVSQQLQVNLRKAIPIST